MNGALDDLRDLGDLIVGWTRTMTDAERLAAIQQWWTEKGLRILRDAALPPRPIHELLDDEDLAVMAEDNDWAAGTDQ